MSLIESHSQDPTIEQWLHILSVDPEYKAAVHWLDLGCSLCIEIEYNACDAE